MKLQAAIGSTLLALSLSLPALAAAPAADAPKPAAADTDKATANLMAHIKQAQEFAQSLKNLKSKGKAVTAAEYQKLKDKLAKFKAMAAEAKAEGGAAKSLILSAAITRAEKELAKLDPLAKPAPAKP